MRYTIPLAGALPAHRVSLAGNGSAERRHHGANRQFLADAITVPPLPLASDKTLSDWKVARPACAFVV
jgi:hypothetical protein